MTPALTPGAAKLSADLERWGRRDRSIDTGRARFYTRMSRFVRVHPGDDWAPNYMGVHFRVLGTSHIAPDLPRSKGEYVRVCLHVHHADLSCRISIWGADDLGLGRDDMPLAEGLELWCRLTRNTCPPYASLITRWGFGRA